MGNHRFRLSDMMPNAWFYKLRDMNKPHHPHTRKTQKQPPPPAAPTPPPTPNQPQLPNRASYYFPSNSPQLHPRVHHPLSSTTTRPSLSESDSDFHSYYSITTPPPKDDIVDFDVVGSELLLRPILTKPPPAAAAAAAAKTVTVTKKQDHNPKLPSTSPARSKAVQYRLRSSTRALLMSSPVNSRKGVRRAPASSPSRSRSRRTRGIRESFAVVKSSSDPKTDFRESMMEMILENHLTASKDLEDLLACFLALNSNDYHDIIVEVFEEIWLRRH